MTTAHKVAAVLAGPTLLVMVAAVSCADPVPYTATPSNGAPRPVPAPATSSPPVVDDPIDDKAGPAYFAACRQARTAGAAPLYRGEPGYRAGLNEDGDGVACDRR